MLHCFKCKSLHLRFCYLINCPCNTILNPLCFLKFPNQKSSMFNIYTMSQGIHPQGIKSQNPQTELPQSQAHYAHSATGVQFDTCDNNKRLLSFCFPLSNHSCQLPFHRQMENCTSQQSGSHLYLSISQGFDGKII